MPFLNQCVPILNKEEVDLCEDERVQKLTGKLDELKTFVLDGIRILQENSYMKRFLIPDIRNQIAKIENDIFEELWTSYEEIPEAYWNSCIPSDISNYHNTEPEFGTIHPLGRLSKYPITNVSHIVELADKLDMVILPMEYADMESLRSQFGKSWFGEGHLEAIEKCEKHLEEIGKESNLYILCPLSYYSFWNEIREKKSKSKYYPVSFESIFTTIDLMAPTQRNLYNMANVATENTYQIKADMQNNINLINDRLKKIERRITKIEAQIEQIEKERLKKEEREQLIFNELRKAIEEQRTYRMLDPMVFFTMGNPIDFDSGDVNTKKAHLVACYGPEFPTEFFTVNDVTVYSSEKLDIIF